MATHKDKLKTFDRELKAERDYWVEKLSNGVGMSSIKLDYKRPANYSAEKGTLNITIHEYQRQQLTKLTGDSPFLLYTTMLAALKICLYKYTGSDSIVIGSPARLKENAPNPVINALAIVDNIDPQISFRAFLLKVRETLLQSYSKQNYPFDRIIKHLGLEKVHNKCALFDVAMEFSDIHWELHETKNDLTLSLHKSAEGISGNVTYNKSLFREESIERFVDHWLTLLSAALTNLDASIAELEMLTETERQQLLNYSKGVRTDYSPYTCIHKLFESQVERTPEAVALIFEGEELSYSELNSRSNQLANYLQKSGIGPETCVGIYMERSTEMIVAILGVLKAGAAYVPLNPSYPKQRLSFMLEDSHIQVLLTQQRLKEELPPFINRIVYLDADWETISNESGENLHAGETAENLAYVIYTSGSTGTPKGIMVSHSGLGNLVEAQVQAFDITSNSRVLQFASFAFDASVSEIFTTLTAGATLVLENQQSLMSGTGLLESLRKNKITTVTLPPAILATFEPDDLPALTTMVAAGEACPPGVADQWSKGQRFINAYGPTETSVCASMFNYAETGSDSLPIGRPISNTQIYLLDSRLRTVPVGVAGELYVGGICLARGYVNRPELTAERFIPDPFSHNSGARLYKSGDMARWMPDGNIEFIGRADFQVKIRGFRVELQEIEHALRSHPDVFDALIITRENSAGDSQIVAYVIAESQQSFSERHLREFLKEKLPAYMMPVAFVVMDAFPLTTNGKIDRRALPPPKRDEHGLMESYVAPRNETEEQLALIWADVLGVKLVGVNENFFEMGGHSLLATKIITRVRDSFNVEIPLGIMFESGTVAGLAQAILKAHENQQTADITRIEAVSRVDHELDELMTELEGISEEELRALIANDIQS